MLLPGIKILRSWPVLKGREYSVFFLLGMVTLASIMPLLLLGIYGLSHYVANKRSDQLDRLTRYNAILANAIDRELRGYLDMAQALAASRHLPEGDLLEFGLLARDVKTKVNGHFVLTDHAGRQFINTRVPIDISLPETDEMGSLIRVLETREPAVSDLFADTVSKLPYFAVRVPVMVRDETRYVLSFELGPDVIHSVVQQTYLPDGWAAAVIDGTGRIIARSFRHEEFKGRHADRNFFARLVGPRGITDSVDLDGREVVTSYEYSKLSDWRILVWTPRAVLNQPLQESLYLALGLAALTLLASLAAGFLSGRVIAKPIRRLHKVAQALKAGQLVRFEPTGQREANVVGYALVEAAQSIAAREKALRESELHTRLIVRELAHRSKNLLTVIQAIARQTSRTATDVNEFTQQFGERLASLGRSQDLLVQQNWQGVALEDLVRAQLKPFIDEKQRIAIQGPLVLLSSDAAQSIGMALHELATNASKHGALSVPTGHVDVIWDWQPDTGAGRKFCLTWRETGGPEVKAPTRKGFGHIVIEQLTAANVRGTAKLHWLREGVVWTLETTESALAGHRGEREDAIDEAGGADLLKSSPSATENTKRAESSFDSTT